MPNKRQKLCNNSSTLVNYLYDPVDEKMRRLLTQYLRNVKKASIYDQEDISKAIPGIKSEVLNIIPIQLHRITAFIDWVQNNSVLMNDFNLCRRMIQHCFDLYERTDSIVQCSDHYHDLLFSTMTPNINNLRKTLFRAGPISPRMSAADTLKIWSILKLPQVPAFSIFASALFLLFQRDKLIYLELITKISGRSRWVDSMAKIVRDDFHVTIRPGVNLDSYCDLVSRWMQNMVPEDLYFPMIRDGNFLYFTTWHSIMVNITDMTKAYLVASHDTAIYNKNRVRIVEKSLHKCCICLEDSTGYITTLPCAHEFHSVCIKEWWNTSDVCPLCRAISEIQSCGDDMQEWIKKNPFIWSRLNTQQQVAFSAAIVNNLAVITGPGGTGKTEVASAIGHFIHETIENKFNQKSVFIAPTGKAANQLKTRLGSKADWFQITTIHSWIMSSETRPDPKKCIPFLILDEASMVDLWLTWHMLSLAKREGVVRLIIMGDHHQLEPVHNSGTLLHALVTHGSCVNHLTQNYRAANGLLGLLQKVREVADGTRNTLQKADFETAQSKLIIMSDQKNDCFTEMYQILVRELANFPDPASTRIITSIRRPLLDLPGKDLEREQTLQTIHNYFNFSSHRRGGQWCKMDLVLSSVNIKSEEFDETGESLGTTLLVSNGSEGVVIVPDIFNLTVQFPDLIVTSDTTDKKEKKLLDELRHGWITTVHKFQGSEMDNVITLFQKTKNPTFNTIQLLYTSLSRAKENLVIIMDTTTLRAYCSKPIQVFRNHLFNEMIQNTCFSK